MKNAVGKWSVIGGLFASIFFLGPIVISADRYMDPEQMGSGEVIGYTVMILSMLCVFFGVRAYRTKNAEEHFPFMKALGIGLQITVLANLIFYLANVFLYEVISPDFLSEFGTHYKEYLVNTAETEEAKKAALEKFNAEAGLLENSFLYAAVMAGTTFFIGIIISLISAMALRRKPVID